MITREKKDGVIGKFIILYNLLIKEFKDKVDWVWNNHNRINGNNETKPCLCGSAAGHWARAMETIRSFIKRVEG